MIKRKKAILAYLFLMVMTLCAACGKSASDNNRSTDAEDTREGGTTSEPVVYTAGEDMCAMYSGAGYTISGSDEFILGGQSSVYGDVFAFLAYRHDEKKDKYETVIGKIDYSGIASMENAGELGATADVGELPEKYVEYTRVDLSSDYAIKRFCFDEENIYALCFTKGEQGFIYSLQTFGADGSMKGKVDIEDEDDVCVDCERIVRFGGGGTEYTALLAIDGKKSLMTVYSSDGSLAVKEEIPYYIQDVFSTADGRLMLVSNHGDDEKYDKCISEYRVGDGLVNIAYIEGIKPYITIGQSEGAFYIQNKDGVYMADEVAGTYGMVLKWSDMGTSGAGSLRCTDAGVFVGADVILDGNEGKVRLLRFEKSDAEYVGDRKQIVIGVSAEADSYLEYMVKLFNSSQGLYEAVIKSYPYSSDRAQRLGTELLTGSGPDLIEANLFDINEYTAVGMVEDLREYLASSDVLDEDMLVESVLKVCSANGRLAVLPVAFGIAALPGKARYIGADEAWTFDEFLESVEKNRGCAVGGIGTAYSTGEYLVMLAYMSDSESFVDWKNFEAHFDSEKFVRLLSYASEYRVDDGYSAETFEKLAAAFADGENIIYDRVISCMAAYQTIGTILGDDAVFKGYPSEGAEPVYKAQLYDSFAINSMSDNKEGAWKFMEFLLTEGYFSGSAYVGEPGSDTSFPIVKSKLYEVFDVAKEIKSVYDESGEPLLDAQGNPKQQKKGTMNGVDYYAAADEDVEAVSFMIERIGSVYTSNQIIEDIIYEEISALFAGQSTPQATAELIQDRVQLYLDEKK